MTSSNTPDQSILFTNVRIFDSTGSDPYEGEVLVEGERIAEVRKGTGDLPRDARESSTARESS